jgi:alanyl aminopeptidase
MRNLTLVVLVLCSCGPATGPSASSKTTLASAPTPQGASGGNAAGVKLAGTFQVRGYRPTLTIDPSEPTFMGSMFIDGTLAAPTRDLWFHGKDLTVVAARVKTAGRPDVVLAPIAGPPSGRMGLRAPQDLPAGDVTVVLDYHGKVTDTNTHGLFRQQYDGSWYVYSQFEAISARRAFPCVDEPGVKVPWAVSLDIPANLSAVSNGKVESETLQGGRKLVKFEATPPLPSYLIALGVGPFEFVDGGKSRSGAPLRAVVLKGRRADARYFTQESPKVLAWMEDWMGLPYPYSKLDALTIPTTLSFGAMEHPGLITYRQDLILLPASASVQKKRRMLLYLAHELAHQWFGNLVTPTWWDELWLNESFATWLSEKLMADRYPTPSSGLYPVVSREDAFAADRFASARRVRQPITSEDDIVTAFDSITYDKGAALLRMVEAWLGEGKFRDGVRAYLKNHAHGTASSGQFVAEMAGAATVEVSPVISTFLDQSGIPELSLTSSCDQGKRMITVSQARHAPDQIASAGAGQTWRIPMCVRWGARGGKPGKGPRSSQCFVLEPVASSSVEVIGAGCADWLFPNQDGVGYYRVRHDQSAVREVREVAWPHLTAHERLAFAYDLAAQADAGGVDIAEVLSLAAQLVQDPTKPNLEFAAKLLTSLIRWIPRNDPALAQWVDDTFGEHAARLGWQPQGGENPDVQDMRGAVVPLVAELGKDRKLADRAVALAPTWRRMPDSARSSLLVAAVRRQPAVADGLLADYVAEKERARRRELGPALAAVPERKRLDASLALIFDDRVDPRDAMHILFDAAADPVTGPWAEEFAIANLDRLLRRLPSEMGTDLAYTLVESCDPAKAGPNRALATAKLGALPGGELTIVQAFESLQQCVARRQRMEPGIKAWLLALSRPTP